MNRHSCPQWIHITASSLLIVLGSLINGDARGQEAMNFVRIHSALRQTFSQPVTITLPPVNVAPITSPVSVAPVVSPANVAPVASPVSTTPPVAAAMVDGGSAAGGGSGGNFHKAQTVYIAIVCTQITDGSAECQRGVRGATEALRVSMAQEGSDEVLKDMVKIGFPALLNRTEQLQFLKKMEESAISTMELTLNLQLKTLTAFQQSLPADKAMTAIHQDEQSLNQINQEARREAASGQNWTHQWETNTHTYQSDVYNQPQSSWHMSPQLQHEWDCAGAGSKSGCNWDGRNNSNLYSK